METIILKKIKMMRFVIAFFLFTNFLFYRPIDSEPIITQNGIGSLLIGQSTLRKVKRVFPDGKVIKHIWGGKHLVSIRYMDGTSGSAIMKEPKTTTKDYFVEELGLLFRFNKQKKLYRIEISDNYPFKTDKGIIVGKSTFGELDTLYYSTTQWGRRLSGYELVKSHGNMSFLASYSDKNTMPNDSLIIDRIEIHGK